MKALKKKVLAISGSTRNHSTNEAILKSIAESYKESLEVQIFTEIATLPHFNPDMDKGEIPQSVRNFRKAIQASDGVLICTPEYVFSLPGTLKNAIEWTVSTTVFSHKPVGLIVASASGEKAYESLMLIMKTLEAKTGPRSALLIKGAKGKINEQGFFKDQKTQEALDTLIHSFKDSMAESVV